MEPKKYVGHFEYELRRLQDDFLEALPDSKEGKEANLKWRLLTREVHLGLKDRYLEVANTQMATRGLQIFRWWYE